MSKTPTKAQTSLETAIRIIESATVGELSLSEGSRQAGFGRNYVSDIKSKVEGNLEAKKINRETYRTFKRVLKAYNKIKA